MPFRLFRGSEISFGSPPFHCPGGSIPRSSIHLSSSQPQPSKSYTTAPSNPLTLRFAVPSHSTVRMRQYPTRGRNVHDPLEAACHGRISSCAPLFAARRLSRCESEPCQTPTGTELPSQTQMSQSSHKRSSVLGDQMAKRNLGRTQYSHIHGKHEAKMRKKSGESSVARLRTESLATTLERALRLRK